MQFYGSGSGGAGGRFFGREEEQTHSATSTLYRSPGIPMYSVSKVEIVKN